MVEATEAKPNEPIVYLNGDFVPLGEAKISVLDQGFLLGDGVFDVVSAWRGSIFKLDQHIDRFFDSLRATRLETTMTRDNWRAAIVQTCRRNGLRDASIRFIVTRGAPNAVVADPRDFEPTRIVWAAPYIFLAGDATRRTGIRLHITHLRAFSPDTLDARYKCLDRLHSQMARIEALEAGYDDVIWLDQAGYACEGPASNIFAVKDGVVRTPGRNVLRGITRQTFIELAKESLNNPMFAVSRGRGGLDVKLDDIADRPGAALVTGYGANGRYPRRSASFPAVPPAAGRLLPCHPVA